MSTPVETITQEKFDVEDENRFAHYAEKISIIEGYILGTPVLAICGKIFVPTRDPEKFPVCPICKEIAEALFLPSE